MANGHISDEFADRILAAVLTGDVSGFPSELKVGLTLELPSDANGTGIEVPIAGEYAPVTVPVDVSSWNSMGVGSRSMESAVHVVFAQAEEDWGQILGYTLYDQDDVYLGYGIINPFIITEGMIPRLPTGLIVITMPI